MKKLIFFLIIVMLISCSPRYHTEYYKLPLKNQNQIMCTQICEGSRQSCIQMENQNYQHCKNIAEMTYQNCLANRVYVYNQKKNRTECKMNCYCSRNHCSQPNYELCEENYRQCYVACGGEIKARTTCVSNCEAAVPDHSFIINKQGRIVVDD